jgi:hypothetical protein
MKQKSYNSKINKILEINRKLQEFVPLEISRNFSRVKSLDNLNNRSILNPNKLDIEVSQIKSMRASNFRA